MIKEFNILIAGVGGQGVILMSELIGGAALKEGLSVRGSEVLGMAVRGGSVSSTVRIGSEVYGPLIPLGKCDILVGMEPSEALRNITCLSKYSTVLLNTTTIVPFTVPTGQSGYPDIEVVIEKLGSVSSSVIKLDAGQIVGELGNPMAANIVMLGALFGTEKLPIKIKTIKEIIREHFPDEAAKLNLQAFDLGHRSCQHTINSAA